MKKLSALLGFLLSFQIGFAQPTIEWQRCYGGNGTDQVNDIQPAADGGFIFAGSTNAVNGDVGGPAKGTQDIWVVKTNSTGAIEWDTVLGGSNGEVARAVLSNADGSYLIAAQTGSSDGDITGHKGVNDIWLAKLSGTGSLLWSQCYGGSSGEIPWSIITAADGNYLVSGNTSSTDGDISGNHGSSDFFVLKINAANGNIIWQRCYGGSYLESVCAMSATSAGGFILCGTSTSSDGDLTASYGGGDMWVIKADSAGNIIWQKSIGGTKYEKANNVIETLDGGVAAIGATQSNDTDITGYKDSADLVLVKLSPAGSIEWVKALGGTRYDEGWDLKQRTDSSLLIVGATYSADNDVTDPAQGDDDVWFAVVDTKGVITSQTTMGGTKREFPLRMAKLSDSSVIIAAMTLSDDGDVAGGGFHPGTSSISYDIWLVKLKVPLPVSVPALSAGSGIVQVFPTYTKDQIHVVFDGKSAKRTMTLTNAAGQIAMMKNGVGSHEIVDLSGLPAGMYFLHVSAGDERCVYKVIYQP